MVIFSNILVFNFVLKSNSATFQNGKTFPVELYQSNVQQATDDNYDPYLHRKVEHPLT